LKEFPSGCVKMTDFEKLCKWLSVHHCLLRAMICNICLLFSPSHDGTDSPPDADEAVVILNNFKSKIIKVKVSWLY
jgi:hypothetical protein